MIRKLTIQAFKSLADVTLELGQVNVFIGANGSGKSNLLEAVGVLSAAANGKVDDEALMRRGVRPGVPSLYKCALKRIRIQPHIFLGAENDESRYEVALRNPLNDPQPAWSYNTELWRLHDTKLASRSSRTAHHYNPQQGLAALEAVQREADDPALSLLAVLQTYAIYEPNTPTLRGIAQERQPRPPVGLSGGGLPQAMLDIFRQIKKDKLLKEHYHRFKSMIDWAETIGSCPANKLQLSPSAMTTPQIIRFTDKFMQAKRNMLSGADASEGALYILFAAALILDTRAPKLLAVDNMGHALNPRLARALISQMCESLLTLPTAANRQLLLTTHNPLTLDGLPLTNDSVRLFTVERASDGKTVVRRIEIDERLQDMADAGWTLSRLWTMGHLGGVPNV